MNVIGLYIKISGISAIESRDASTPFYSKCSFQNVFPTLSEKKVQKLTLGLYLFKRYTFVPKGCILVPYWYILAPKMYILGP